MEAAEQLTFDPKIEIPESFLRPAAPSGDKDAMLARACDGDAKCVCVNRAIFVHDSSWATKGVGARTLGPCNMRVPATWTPSVPLTAYRSPGNGTFAKFESLEDGVTACVELYQRHYADLPAHQLVSRWTDGGGNANYRAAVSACF